MFSISCWKDLTTYGFSTCWICWICLKEQMSEKTFTLLHPSASINWGSMQDNRPAISLKLVGIGLEVEQIILLHAILFVASLWDSISELSTMTCKKGTFLIKRSSSLFMCSTVVSKTSNLYSWFRVVIRPLTVTSKWYRAHLCKFSIPHSLSESWYIKVLRSVHLSSRYFQWVKFDSVAITRNYPTTLCLVFKFCMKLIRVTRFPRPCWSAKILFLLVMKASSKLFKLRFWSSINFIFLLLRSVSLLILPRSQFSWLLPFCWAWLVRIFVK